MLPSRQQYRCKRKWPERLCEVCQLPVAGTVGRFLDQILLYNEKFKQVCTSLPHFTGPVPGKQTWFFLSSIVPSFVGPLSHEILSGLWILYIYYFKYFTTPGVIWCSWTEFLISYGTRLSELKKKFSLNGFLLNSWTCSIVDRLKLNCLGYKHSWFTLTLAPRLGKASSGM